MYDGFRRCIHRYSYLGIKYDKITCGEQIESGSITDVNVIANRELLLTLSCGIDDLYNYAILSADDGSLKAYILPYQVNIRKIPLGVIFRVLLVRVKNFG